MGLRFQRRVKILPGVGLSVGAPRGEGGDTNGRKTGHGTRPSTWRYSGEGVNVSDIQKAREIETMRYMKRIEELNAEEQQRVLKIKSDAAASGRSQGGGILTAISA